MPRAKKKTTTKVSKKKDVQVEEAPVEVVVLEEETTTTTKKKRRTPTRDSVLSELDELIELVDSEITSIREGSTKNKGIKILRSINKRVKIIKKSCRESYEAKT